MMFKKKKESQTNYYENRRVYEHVIWECFFS